MTEKFILRRTSVTNSKYLPPKVEYTVFCKLSDFQGNKLSNLKSPIAQPKPTQICVRCMLRNFSTMGSRLRHFRWSHPWRSCAILQNFCIKCTRFIVLVNIPHSAEKPRICAQPGPGTVSWRIWKGRVFSCYVWKNEFLGEFAERN